MNLCCQKTVPAYIGRVTLDRILIHGALACLLVLLVSGCGGFTASKSISPASFLLPGVQNTPPPPDPFDPLTNPDPAFSLVQAR